MVVIDVAFPWSQAPLLHDVMDTHAWFAFLAFLRARGNRPSVIHRYCVVAASVLNMFQHHCESPEQKAFMEKVIEWHTWAKVQVPKTGKTKLAKVQCADQVLSQRVAISLQHKLLQEVMLEAADETQRTRALAEKVHWVGISMFGVGYLPPIRESVVTSLVEPGYKGEAIMMMVLTLLVK